MADQAKLGTIWHSDELDAIVEGYFVMLTAELSGRPYVKLRHSESLMARIGRTHRSVEFKHQNISAVMDELGMPWISGYKPKRNYQKAIFDAIDRYLTKHSLTLEFPSIPPITALSPSGIFVDPPVKTAEGTVLPYGLQRQMILPPTWELSSASPSFDDAQMGRVDTGISRTTNALRCAVVNWHKENTAIRAGPISF